MLNVFLGGQVAADWASLLFRQIESDHVAELVFLSCPLHEPVSIDAKCVETVVTVVNSNEVWTISESLCLEISLTFSKWLKADGAASTKCIVILTDALSQALIQLE